LNPIIKLEKLITSKIFGFGTQKKECSGKIIKKKSLQDLKLLLLKSLFRWMNASSLFYFDNMFDMLDTCSFGA